MVSSRAMRADLSCLCLDLGYRADGEFLRPLGGDRNDPESAVYFIPVIFYREVK